MRRITTVIASLSVIAAGAFTLPALSQAADGTGAYGTWAVSGADGSVTFSGTIFPNATITSTQASLGVAKSATLGTNTPFGIQYGSSSGKTYLTSAIASGKPDGSLTITFDTPAVPGTWSLAFGDVDAEDLKVSATGPTGAAINTGDWAFEPFNYAGGADLPNWDPATGRLNGNGVDTNGASAWVSPADLVKTITITQVRTSGFPQYQLWIAADIITATPAHSPIASQTAVPTAPAGKVVICHATNSTRNPYVEMTVSQDSINKKNGHDTHDGPVFPAANWGDIIPPFPGYAGQNWPGGASILNNGCETGAEALAAEPAPSASASPSSSGSSSASASPSGSATDSSSASTSASASGSASPSAGSGSATPSTSSTPASEGPTGSEPPAETRIVDLTEPEPEPVSADEPTPIDPGPGNTITDADPPTHGTVVVRDGEIIYTPEPGYVGPVEIPVTYTDRDGNVMTAVIELNVGKEQKAAAALPTKLHRGSNVVLAAPVRTNARQVVKVSITCAPLTRIGKLDGAPRCTAWRSGGRTVLYIGQPASVTVHLSAPKKGSYGPYDLVRRYTVR